MLQGEELGPSEGGDEIKHTSVEHVSGEVMIQSTNASLPMGLGTGILLTHWTSAA